MIAHLHSIFKPLAFEVIGKGLQNITGAASSLEAFKSPVGDPGLFGPQSVVWKVHADFSAMMVGGLSSLMIQALHPRALAAVWDHSNFREQLKARLGRTALFVASTTYGGVELATQSIQRVNAIHAKIAGIDLQGQPYKANEPDLLRWVHLIETVSFLNAYQHLALRPLSVADCNQYVVEMNKVGEMLGAVNLPTTLQDVQHAIGLYEPVLTFDHRTRETLQSIENYSVGLTEKPFFALILQSSFDIMPQWLLEKMQRSTDGCLQINARRLALQLASQPVQWMLDEQGVCAVAKARMA
ncbi:MAG: hypothetical protein RLZZ433_535 [Pseudomonadota bacterium]